MLKVKHPSSVGARVVRHLRFLHNLRGWQRLADAIVPKDARLEFVACNAGMTFVGNLHSFIDRQIYLYGGYEQTPIKQFIDLVPSHRRGVAIDVGANVGTHTLSFARAFNRVISFEPNPAVYAQLRRNAIASDARNVELHDTALADRDDRLSLHAVDNSNHGLATLSEIEQYDLPLKVVCQVDVRRADTLLSDRLESLDAIKVDVQGLECEVLLGFGDLLARHRPWIWFEVGTASKDRLGSVADLRAVIPFEFSLQRFRTIKGALWNQVELAPFDSNELDLGDYVVVPRAESR